MTNDMIELRQLVGELNQEYDRLSSDGKHILSLLCRSSISPIERTIVRVTDDMKDYIEALYWEYDRMSSSGKETLARMDLMVQEISDPAHRFFYLKKRENK